MIFFLFRCILRVVYVCIVAQKFEQQRLTTDTYYTYTYVLIGHSSRTFLILLLEQQGMPQGGCEWCSSVHPEKFVGLFN